MNEIIFEKPGMVTVEWDPKIKSVIVHWTDLSDGSLVKECCEAQFEQIKKGARIIIVDVANAKGMIPMAVQDWFKVELFPKMDQAGLVEIITVNPEDKKAVLSAQSWKIKGHISECKFQMPSTGALQTAREMAEKMVAAM